MARADRLAPTNRGPDVMTELKIWGDEKPDVGRYFIAYGRHDEEPSLCEMFESGPRHSQFNWSIEYTGYGEGGTLLSELFFTDDTRWHYVETEIPDWPAIHAKTLDDGVKP